MKEKGIIFNGDMVRAILDGRKSMTRRVLKPQPKDEYSNGKWVCDRYNYSEWWNFWGKKGTDVVNKCGLPQFKCPYGQPGDRLWVRETFSRCGCDACLKTWPKQGKHEVTYIADYAGPSGIVANPSIFMPRWASRITLEITNVRVERLQEISEEDAKAEGCSPMYGPGSSSKDAYRPAFQVLWDYINGKKYPWASNPWVWVISFKWNELPEVK